MRYADQSANTWNLLKTGDPSQRHLISPIFSFPFLSFPFFNQSYIVVAWYCSSEQSLDCIKKSDVGAMTSPTCLVNSCFKSSSCDFLKRVSYNVATSWKKPCFIFNFNPMGQ